MITHFFGSKNNTRRNKYNIIAIVSMFDFMFDFKFSSMYLTFSSLFLGFQASFKFIEAHMLVNRPLTMDIIHISLLEII
jgi:hypothetical protein